MNLLRKNLAFSVPLRGKPSPVSIYLSSLLRESSRLCSSAQAVEFGERQSGVTVSSVVECNTVSGSLIAQRRFMSTSRGRSMRSKVEKRMQRETGKTLREMRRAKKLRKKLMTEDERLIYNLRRAKKKVALLLQKLKKFELPDLPPPRHDPELLTEEQLQAYKKIGFRNRNYVPVGVRGVFGGVVQNMHLHWKFHETVQVCCDNFPKEKIREMAIMLARLSGGIVVNIHDVKTIIMFRGRNYRQPKNLIPLNTLTKRKALFKARFEQALESQQLNIKKIEQQLRRKGVNPEDPVHMASIQRVASTFFRAIDEQQGTTPYVFKQPEFKNEELEIDLIKPNNGDEEEEEEEDSDQEELDRYIKEIEDAADQEWEEEEAAEKEQENRIRYWSNEDYRNNRQRGRFEGEEEEEEEDSGDDDFGNREERNGFGPYKTYRSRENNAFRKAVYDRSRNGAYGEDYREENFNKLKGGRSGRVGFDSDYKENFGHRRRTDNEGFLRDSDEDFGDNNNGFRFRKGYNGQCYKGSKGMDRRVEFESDGDELDESDKGFGSRSRSRWDKSESELESDGGEELDLAASKDYGLDYASINDSYEKRDVNNGESSKKNSDESWDSD